MSGLVDRLAADWWTWALPAAAQVALVALVAAFVDLLCVRRARPRLQTLLWAFVLVKFLVPPWLASPFSVARLVAPPTLAAPGADVPSVGMEFVRAAAAVWLAGTATLLVAGAWRHRRERSRVLRTSLPADADARAEVARAAMAIGLRRAPEARIVDRLDEAAVFGVRRPVVLLPAPLLEGDRSALHHVLLHECAHLRRRDPLRALLAFVVAALAWPHPLAWLARHRLAGLAEIGCDDLVARTLGDGGATYRRTLADVARRLLGDPNPPRRAGRLAFILPGWPGRSLLLARLEHLRRGVAPRSRLDAIGLVVAAAVVAAAFLPLANPPTPRDALWAQSRGCLEKRLLFWSYLGERSAAPIPSASDTPSED
jgi:beta-lactamase regulating signal transducer with metallopeptidase domain